MLSDGYEHMYLCSGSGVPPGLFGATDIFNWQYGRILEQYFEATKTMTNMMLVKSIFDENVLLCTAHSSFVDDVATTAATCNVPEIPGLINNISAALDTCFAPHFQAKYRKKSQHSKCPWTL